MISKNSRYNKCQILKTSKTAYLSFRKRIKYSYNLDDRFHVVVEEDRLDLIAYKFFGNAQLWWIIADVNEIDFPLQIPDVGTVLRIPSNERVFMEILR